MSQATLLPNLLPENCPAQPSAGVTLNVPSYARFIPQQGLVPQIQERQRSAAADRGLDCALDDLVKPEAYASFFRLNHVEGTLFGRYRLNALPPGSQDPFLTGLSRWLHLSADQVRRLLTAMRTRRRLPCAAD